MMAALTDRVIYLQDGQIEREERHPLAAPELG